MEEDTNYYDGNILICRYFYLNPDHASIDETFTTYYSYYDEFGKLISGTVAHYRSLLIDVYFQNDEVIYVDGPTQGGLDEVIAAIKESEKRSVILNDISYC